MHTKRATSDEFGADDFGSDCPKQFSDQCRTGALALVLHQPGQGRASIAPGNYLDTIHQGGNVVSTMNVGMSSLGWFTRRALIGIGLAALWSVALFLLWWARHIVFLAIAGILLAIFLTACAGGLHRFTRLRYGWALTVAVVGILIILGLVGWLIGARVSTQTGQLAQDLPKSAQQVEIWFEETPVGRALLQFLPHEGQPAFIGDVVSQAASLLGSLAQAVADAIVVVFVGLYGAAQPDLYRRGLLHLVPMARRPRIEQVLDEVVYTLRWWILGQLLSMVLIGVLVGLGLWLIGLELPLALGMLAFLLEIIPYAGPFLSLMPAVLLATTHGFDMVCWVLAVFCVVHVVEGYIVMPLVQVRAIRLSPALYVLAAVLLFWLGGILGVLIAAPLVISVIVLVRMLYVEDTLGDWEAAPPGHDRPAVEKSAA